MPLIYLPDICLNARLEGPTSAPVLVFAHALGTDLSIWDGVLARLQPRFRTGSLVHNSQAFNCAEISFCFPLSKPPAGLFGP